MHQFEQNQKPDNYFQLAACLTQLKKQEETRWLGEVNSQSLQAALAHLVTAFVNFRRGNAALPRFKRKRKKNRFTVPQFVRVANGKLYFTKFKHGIKLIQHREIKGVIKHCPISQNADRKILRIYSLRSGTYPCS